MTPEDGPAEAIRLPELCGALSLAIDIGMAQPLEHGLHMCRTAVRFAQSIGLEPELQRRVYYLALIGHIGCNADVHEFGDLVGDELMMRSLASSVDWGSPPAVMRFMAGHMSRAYSPLQVPYRMGRLMANMGAVKSASRSICEVGQLLGSRLGFTGGYQQDLAGVNEFWNGRGQPGNLKAEEISVPARIFLMVQVAVALSRLQGPQAAASFIRSRGGSAFDPDMVGPFCDAAGDLLGSDGGATLWDEVVALEPLPGPALEGERLEAALGAAADFVDLKAPFLAGHSRGVARLAEAAAQGMGLTGAEVTAVRHAGLLHDLGRVGVQVNIWTKKTPLSVDEWERVRMHAYYTDRVLARPEALRRIGHLASAHHERLDGSGYFRGQRGAQLGAGARVLAAADSYHAMAEDRPHRPALATGEARDQLRSAVRAGHLDADAAEAVLTAAGHASGARRALPGGLTARELEVLALLARGGSVKDIARGLVIAPKTADAHVQHIYSKLGVSTRAAATVRAMELGVVG
jgi:HD-GYP domain-containing protein (c-di-GMP phosphodiesterase class II)